LIVEMGSEAPSQEEVLELLGQLHTLDLLASGALPDLAEAAQRHRKQLRQRRWQRYLNPLALRFSLLDPDKLLARVVRVLHPVLNGYGAVLWLAWVMPAAILAAAHWSELTRNFNDQMLALGNLALFMLLFPLVKALHEFGHGIACKMRGGEVHEMGVMLLIFLPVPYVDASSAWTFPKPRDRMLVGAAGMLVELVIAAAAFYVWLALEPGVARGVVYDVAVLASVTTLVFNANPLLRYDGYYIASDALEIPNLSQRATRFWGYLMERWLLRHPEATAPVMAPGEPAWFFLYAPLSFAYRMFVMFCIAVFISTKYLAVGVIIALWSVGAGLGVPLFRGLAWLRRSMTDSRTRLSGRLVTLGVSSALALLLFVVPLPHHTQVQGVVWLPDSGVLRAGRAGFVQRLAVANGARVEAGEEILTLRDSSLTARVLEQAARVEAAEARYDAARVQDPALGQQMQTELARAKAELRALEDNVSRLEVRSAAGGRLWLRESDDLPGRYVKQGEVLGYVIPAGAPRIRVVVDQPDENSIQEHTLGIRVKLPFDPSQTWMARVVHAVPAASRELPSAALGREAGGTVATDPRDQTGRKALTSYFEYELALPETFPFRLIGSRASVRFEHPPEPLAYTLWRATRHLFLSYFNS
jgi:putative peptide zinc metalloprotease protein